jgi:hypothetical protein
MASKPAANPKNAFGEPKNAMYVPKNATTRRMSARIARSAVLRAEKRQNRHVKPAKRLVGRHIGA